MSVFGHFRPIFGQKIDPKLPRSHFFPKRIHQKKFQLKIPIFSKSDDDATWWPNSYKKFLTCGQLRNIQRYQKYVRLVRAFFLELRTCSSQQCNMYFPLSHFKALKLKSRICNNKLPSQPLPAHTVSCGNANFPFMYYRICSNWIGFYF